MVVKTAAMMAGSTVDCLAAKMVVKTADSMVEQKAE